MTIRQNESDELRQIVRRQDETIKNQQWQIELLSAIVVRLTGTQRENEEFFAGRGREVIRARIRSDHQGPLLKFCRSQLDEGTLP